MWNGSNWALKDVMQNYLLIYSGDRQSCGIVAIGYYKRLCTVGALVFYSEYNCIQHNGDGSLKKMDLSNVKYGVAADSIEAYGGIKK